MQSECEATEGRIVMSEAAYKAKLYEQFGVSPQKSKEVAAKVAELEGKFKNFQSIQVQLEKIRESNPQVYAEEMQKAEDRVYGIKLSLEEARAFQATFAKREADAEKILENVRNNKTKTMSVILIPEIAAALTPVFGKEISNCFEQDKAPQMVASVAAQKAAQVEWELYSTWSDASRNAPNCTPVVPSRGMENLLKGWYGVKFSGGKTVDFSSYASCKLAMDNSRGGVFCGWAHEGSNYYRLSDGNQVGHNQEFGLVVTENGKDIFPTPRSLEKCIEDLRFSAEIVSDFPGFMAVPKYNTKAQRLGNSFEIVSIWNNRTILDNVPIGSAQPPAQVKTQIQTSKPTQPNTTQIFSGTPPTGNGNQVVNNNGGTTNSNNSGNTNQNTSSPQVQRLVAALKAVKSAFNYVDAGTRDACLSATVTSSEPWSDLMAHYYCQFPIQDNQNAYSVRACFTGSLRGNAPYQKAQGRPAAFSACINRPEFAWLKADQERSAVFELIMAQGPNNIAVADQNKAITEFYGNNPVPVR
jgi:hypothetical protein